HHLGPSAPILFVLVILLSARGIWEFVRLSREVAFSPNVVVCCVSSWTLLASAWWPHLPHENYGWDTFQLEVLTKSNWGVLFCMMTVVVLVLLANAVFRYPLEQEGAESRRGIN